MEHGGVSGAEILGRHSRAAKAIGGTTDDPRFYERTCSLLSCRLHSDLSGESDRHCPDGVGIHPGLTSTLTRWKEDRAMSMTRDVQRTLSETLPYEELLPYEQPAYVHSYVYLFGV